MTPLQALQNLEKAAGEVVAKRDVHIHLMECAKLIGAALLELDRLKSEPKN